MLPVHKGSTPPLIQSLFSDHAEGGAPRRVTANSPAGSLEHGGKQLLRELFSSFSPGAAQLSSDFGERVLDRSEDLGRDVWSPCEFVAQAHPPTGRQPYGYIFIEAVTWPVRRSEDGLYVVAAKWFAGTAGDE